MQQATHPRRWSTRARQRITDISKGVAEILAGLAEPAMRYATVYLALATSISAINYAPAYSFAEGIVIAAPEFVLLGAFSIAEHAIKDGRKRWGYVLFAICIILLGIVVATLYDIFIMHFSDQQLHYLNFARCLTAVGFSIALGKLEKDEAPAPAIGADSQSQSQNQRQPQNGASPVNPAPKMSASNQSHQAPAPSSISTRQAINSQPQTPTPSNQVAGAQPSALAKPASPAAHPLPNTNAGQAEQIAGDLAEKRARRPSKNQDERLEAAYQQLIASGSRVSGRTLALAAHVHRTKASAWLEEKTGATQQNQDDQTPENRSQRGATIQNHQAPAPLSLSAARKQRQAEPAPALA
jgi:hypothetical protein